MLSWLVAVLVAGGVTFLSYGASHTRRRSLQSLAAALRALAIIFLVAAILDAPLGFAGAPAPIVILDASSSWVRGGDTSAWKAALRAARSHVRDSVLLFGDSVRSGALPNEPGDFASRLQPALLRALGSGRSVVLITDGEIDDQPSVLDALPGGSKIIVPERSAIADAAVVSVDAPKYVTSGDSLSVRVSLAAGQGGAQAGNITLLLGDRIIAASKTDSMPPQGEQVIVLRGFWDGRDNGPMLLRTIIVVVGDREVRNDTLLSAVEASTTPSVVFVSTSPDLDARYALSVLRGTLSLPTRAFLRVSPGNWRLEGPLSRVDEAEVRRSVADAPVVILHGDTALFGQPRSNTRGALALFSTATDGGDWYPSGSPASPIAGALSGIPWDSLPPIEVSARLPAGNWEALEARRSRQTERRRAVSGTDEPRRIAVIGAAGLWRWAFKGGVSGDAFAALWGSVFDWLVAERADDRPASPASLYFRAGEPIVWKRGSKADTLVLVSVTSRRAGATPDTLQLHFGATGTTASSPALPSGVYDVTSSGGASLLVVNESYEVVPRRSNVSSGEVTGVSPAGERRGSRRSGGVFIVIVVVLCAEWLLRRRLGLR